MMSIISNLLSVVGSSALSILSSGCWVSCDLRTPAQGLSTSSYTRHLRVHASFFALTWIFLKREISFSTHLWVELLIRSRLMTQENISSIFLAWNLLVECYKTVSVHSEDDKVFHGKVKVCIQVLKTTLQMISFPGFAGMGLAFFH